MSHPSCHLRSTCVHAVFCSEERRGRAVLQGPLVLPVFRVPAGRRCPLLLCSWTVFFLLGGEAGGSHRAEGIKAEHRAALSTLSQEPWPRKAPGWARLPPSLSPSPVSSSNNVGLGGLHQTLLRDFWEPTTFRLCTRREEGGGGVSFTPSPLF